MDLNQLPHEALVKLAADEGVPVQPGMDHQTLVAHLSGVYAKRQQAAMAAMAQDSAQHPPQNMTPRAVQLESVQLPAGQFQPVPAAYPQQQFDAQFFHRSTEPDRFLLRHRTASMGKIKGFGSQKAGSVRDGFDDSWSAPSVEEAKRYADTMHPRLVQDDGTAVPWPLCHTQFGRHWFRHLDRGDPFNEGTESQLVIYGAGISNYFKFVKWLAWTFSVMAVIAIPIIVFNTWGAAGSTASVADLAMQSTTVGNLGDTRNITQLSLPFIYCGGQWCTADKPKIAVMYTLLDLCYCLVFVFSFLWLRYFETLEGREADRQTITADDYTVRTRSVPKDTDAESLAQHLHEVTGHRVARVFLVEDNQDLVSAYVKRGEVLNQLIALDEELRYVHHQQERKQAEKLLKKRVKLLNKVDELTAKATAETGEPAVIGAFVTFETESGRLVCEEMYPNTLTAKLFQRAEKRYKGKALGFQRAPKASTVLWENLGVRRPQRTVRQFFSSVFAFVCICISIVLVVLSAAAQRTARSKGGSGTCIAGQSFYTNGTLSVESQYMHCYCTSLSATQFVHEQHCVDWVSAQSLAVFLSVVGSVTVLVVNNLLNILMKKLSDWERHHSIDERELSFASRLFLVLWFNTSWVALLVNARIQFLDSLQGQTYADFVTEWYFTVGGQIMLTMLLQIVAPHAAPLSRFFLFKLRQRWNNFKSQRQANEAYVGPDFHLPIRLAQLLNTVFTTLMFSSGMPLLLPFAAINFIVAYWVDKWMFLRFYNTPPQYDVEIGRSMTAKLPWALFVHLVFGVWMLGNSNIFQAALLQSDPLRNFADGLSHAFGPDFYSHLAGPHAVVMLTYLFVFVVLTFLYLVFVVARTVIMGFLRLVSCGRCGREDEEDEDDAFRHEHPLPNYQIAVDEGYMNGLPTYNMLQNPVYQTAFGITPEFAEQHSRVADVNKYKHQSHA